MHLSFPMFMTFHGVPDRPAAVRLHIHLGASVHLQRLDRHLESPSRGAWFPLHWMNSKNPGPGWFPADDPEQQSAGLVSERILRGSNALRGSSGRRSPTPVARSRRMPSAQGRRARIEDSLYRARGWAGSI